MATKSKEFHALKFTESDLKDISNHFDEKGFLVEDINLGVIDSELITKACKKYAESMIKDFLLCSDLFVYVSDGVVTKALMTTCETKELTLSDVDSYDETNEE